jgi:GT2 family glycosyltransferase
MSDALVSLVILSYNKRAYTEACLRSMATSTHRPLEIVLVEQGSTDGTRDTLGDLERELADAGIALVVHQLEGNVGAPAGRNRGMDVARGETIGWVDNDAVVGTPNWIEELTGRLAADPGVGIVSPKLLFPPPSERIEFAGCAVSDRGRVVYLGRGRPRDDPEFADERDVQCLISACVLLPRSAIDAAGPMDEAFFPVQYEDIDYCYRLKSLGLRCRIVPSVEMYHYEHVTTAGSEDIKFLQVTTKNGMLFRKRWRHVFETEGGPPDELYRWEDLHRPRLDEPDRT